MQDLTDELVVEPRHLSRRARLRAGWLLALIASSTLLGGAGLAPGCTRTASPLVRPSPSRPPLVAGDPLVRNLHLAALDRARTPADDVADDVMPADVRRTTRQVGVVDGVSLYLASGPEFACLGADGRPAHRQATPVCLLNSTIANHGLAISVGTDGTEAAILVVAGPDGAELVTASTTEHLADYGSVAVLRPGQDEVVLLMPGRPPIGLNEVAYAGDENQVRCIEG